MGFTGKKESLGHRHKTTELRIRIRQSLILI